MEFGSQICDDNYMRYVGWQESNECIKSYFSQSTVDLISTKVTQLLEGVSKDGRAIVVPDKTICHIMSSIYATQRPQTGDIYSRYIIPQGIGPQSIVQNMIDRVIEIIVNQVRVDFGMRDWNESLTIWTTVYGDFNEHGLRQHAPIKVLNKHPDRMMFNMNY